jgi:Apea-like HEPN
VLYAYYLADHPTRFGSYPDRGVRKHACSLGCREVRFSATNFRCRKFAETQGTNFGATKKEGVSANTMNRYRMYGKLLLRDAVEIGNLTAVVVKDPKPFTGKLPSGDTPNPTTNSQIILDYEEPTSESPHAPPNEPISFSLEFDAPDEDTALNWGINEIEARADVLTFLTLNPVEVQGMMSCQEITSRKHEGRQSIHEGSVEPGPVILPNEFFTSVMAGTALMGKLSPRLLGSFRWFRKGLEANTANRPEDEFIYYWIALEMIAAEFTEGKQKFMFCHICQTQFKTCPNCGKSTATKALVSDGITNMFDKHLNWRKKKFSGLYGTRSKLMHGNKPISEEFRQELIKGNADFRKALVTGYEALLGFTLGTHPHALRLFFYSDPSPQLRLSFDTAPEEEQGEER